MTDPMGYVYLIGILLLLCVADAISAENGFPDTEV